MESLTFLIPVLGAIALVFALIKATWVNKQDMGTDRMKEICGYVREGAMAGLLALPIANLFLMPIGAVAGTLLYVDLSRLESAES